MPAQRYARADGLKVVPLDGLTLIFHPASGQTHFVAPPVPQILGALDEGPADASELLCRLSTTFDLKPSPSMGEGRVGVSVNEESARFGNATPPQPLPIEGRGLVDDLQDQLDTLDTLGLVHRQ